MVLQPLGKFSLELASGLDIWPVTAQAADVPVVLSHRACRVDGTASHMTRGRRGGSTQPAPVS